MHKIFGFLGRIWIWMKGHIFVTFLILFVIVFVAPWAYGKIFPKAEILKYVLGSVEKTSVVSTVSATGQVSALNELAIKPKTSGEVLGIYIKPGQKVKAGSVIAELDKTDLLKTVRDAKANLESAQISYEKIKKSISDLDIIQVKNSYSNAQDSLEKNYIDSYNHIVNMFLGLSQVMTGLENILIGDLSQSNNQWNMDFYEGVIIEHDEVRGKIFKKTAYDDYLIAKTQYNKAISSYQSLGISPDEETIEEVLKSSLEVSQSVSKAIKSTNTFIQLYTDICEEFNISVRSSANVALSDLSSSTNEMSGYISTFVSDINSIKQNKKTIEEKKYSLDDTLAGVDPLDIRSAELSVEKAKNSLIDAQNNLSYATVRAPFSGIIATVDIDKFNTVNTGTQIATLITDQKIAELSLNEVDVAKIEIGDQTNLTFDAIENLNLTGGVSEIDSLGVVTQGVVSYNVKIIFDAEDARIKSGMTVNASIITDSKVDILAVPINAIVSKDESNFIQIPQGEVLRETNTENVTLSKEPILMQVETGITDDSMIEILSGAIEGQEIVVRRVSNSSNNSSSQKGQSSNSMRVGGFGVSR